MTPTRKSRINPGAPARRIDAVPSPTVGRLDGKLADGPSRPLQLLSELVTAQEEFEMASYAVYQFRLQGQLYRGHLLDLERATKDLRHAQKAASKYISDI